VLSLDAVGKLTGGAGGGGGGKDASGEGGPGGDDAIVVKEDVGGPVDWWGKFTAARRTCEPGRRVGGGGRTWVSGWGREGGRTARRARLPGRRARRR
jgi:hypothetical protein